MTTVAYADGGGNRDCAADAARGANADADAAAADRASRRWRTVWRVHFYAGVFAAPFLVLMALSGLVILYTQPIQDLTQGHLRTVTGSGEWTSLDKQADAVRAAYPDNAITSVAMPRNATTSTSFGLENKREVFVNPYTAEVLGSATLGGGIVGLANRLHGTLNNDKVTVPLVSISGIFGEGKVVERYAVGDLLLEVLGVWALVGIASGVYLWLPRPTRAGTNRRKARLIPRRATRGRARWRDLHATGGIVLCGVLAFSLISGMPWSGYWGSTWKTVADKLTANNPAEPPNSNVVQLGDLDRLANQINWNTGGTPVPNSVGPVSPRPAPVSLDAVVAAADQEGMLPGYSISLPENGTDEAGNPTYGSFTLVNSWPRKTGEARSVFLDQFSGNTLAADAVYGYGAVSRATDTLVSTHMGTQLGVFSRVIMTATYVLTIWAVVTATVMYQRRRRRGSLGFPKRPRDVRVAKRLLVIAVVIGVIYPLWGTTAVVVLGIDRFLIRRIPRLRATFGQT